MNPRDIWDAAYNQIELQLDRASFDTWLRYAHFLGYEEGTFVIGVHNSYACEMLQHRLYRTIRRILTDVHGQSCEIRFQVARLGDKERDEAPATAMPLFQFMARQEPQEDDLPLHQVVQPLRAPDLPESELNPRLTFDRYMVNGSNAMVYEAARSVAENPGSMYNPLLIYGGVGLGKTHLLQAIAHACVERGQRVIYIPSEAFTNDLIMAIRQRTTALFREKYRSVDVLLVDDIQFIGGKDTTQEEFFHTFNALVTFNRQVVLASDRHPRELATLEDRLRSRFQGGLVADIQPPEYETRIAIMEMWAAEREVRVPTEVLDMVARRAPENVRELEGIFNQIVAQARLGGPVSLPRAETALESWRAPRRHKRLRIADILGIIARLQNLSVDDLTGPKRTGQLNHARHVAMYVIRETTDYSLQQIGEAFGRNHTTVLHGCNKISAEMEQDPILAARIQKILRALQQA